MFVREVTLEAAVAAVGKKRPKRANPGKGAGGDAGWKHFSEWR